MSKLRFNILDIRFIIRVNKLDFVLNRQQGFDSILVIKLCSNRNKSKTTLKMAFMTEADV